VNLKALTWVFVAIGFWSTNALGARFALASLTTAQTQFLQFAAASMVFYLFSRSRTTGAKKPKVSLFGLFVGTVGLTGTMVFQYLAFRAGPIVQVNLIAYSWPLLAVLFAIFYREIPNALRQFLVAMIGFAGVSMVVLETTSGNSGGSGQLGVVFALASALCMAGYSYYVGKTEANPELTLLPASLIGCVLTATWCLFEYQPWPLSSAILVGLYLGAGPMGLGYFCWSKGMQMDKAGQLYVLGFLTPVISTLLLTLFGESLGVQAAIGGMIVIIACVMVTQNGQSRSADVRPN